MSHLLSQWYLSCLVFAVFSLMQFFTQCLQCFSSGGICGRWGLWSVARWACGWACSQVWASWLWARVAPRADSFLWWGVLTRFSHVSKILLFMWVRIWVCAGVGVWVGSALLLTMWINLCDLFCIKQDFKNIDGWMDDTMLLKTEMPIKGKISFIWCVGMASKQPEVDTDLLITVEISVMWSHNGAFWCFSIRQHL